MKLKGKPKIIDLIDATSINYQGGKKFLKSIWKLIYEVEANRLTLYELFTLKSFSKSFVSAEFDRSYLKNNSDSFEHNLKVISNGVDEGIFRRDGSKVKEENWITFLGKMNYLPNIDAVTYFAEEVFSDIRQKSGVKFMIVGTRPNKRVMKLEKMEGIEVTGFVEDPHDYLEKSKIVVATLRFGSGMQYKILEAMALGKPVVTTSIGARGIKGQNGKHFIIANSKKDLVYNILELLENSSMRMSIGRNAKELVKNNYTWKIIGKKLTEEVNAFF